MAAGSALWGGVAQRYGIPDALLFAAIVLLLGLLAVPKYRLKTRAVCLTEVPISSGNQL